MSAYDTVALSFDRHRALPDGVPEAIREAILSAVEASLRPRLLDLGAGTGRIGRPFVGAGDDYVGVDLSLGMLREFAQRATEDHAPRLLLANGERLPFRDTTFDAVLLMQVIGAARNWRKLVAEARRVLRPAGALVVGHAVAPAEGIDARMKRRLAAFLDEMGVPSYHMNTRGVVQPWLESLAKTSTRIVAAEWSAERTPRAFLDRQATGARFSALPAPVKDEALCKLTTWATETFGSLDTKFSEQHSFDLQIFKFQ
jgi:ubiquinone/menaquinone biosynthesis C-methylase UbiE